jgi:hypothetical protein
MPILPLLSAGSEALDVDVLGQSRNFMSIDADKNGPIRKLVRLTTSARIHEKFRLWNFRENEADFSDSGEEVQ